MVWWGASNLVAAGLSVLWNIGVEAKFTPQWSTRSVHFVIPPQTEVCDVVSLQNSGFIHQLTFDIPLHDNPSTPADLELRVTVFSDVFPKFSKDDCLFYSSSTTVPNDLLLEKCSNVVSRPLELIGTSLQTDVLGNNHKVIRFDDQIELCINSTAGLIGEFVLHIQHQPPLHQRRTSASHILYSHPPLSLSAEFETRISSRLNNDSIDNRVITFESSSPEVTLEVNSFLDSPSSDLLDCDPNQTFHECNLRSAFFYCNHSLTTHLNSSCLILLPPQGGEILMNMDYGHILVDAKTGNLNIRGNGCRISSINSSSPLSRDQFLVISPPDFSRQLHFFIENCSISHFGSINEGGAVSLIGISSATLRHMSFISNEGTSGGALSIQYANSIECSDCFFFNNSALVGAGMFLSDAFGRGINFVRCEFDSNRAESTGGGLAFSVTDSVNIVSSLFTKNSAQWGGGAISFDESTSDKIRIVDTDFISNSAMNFGPGGAIYFGAGCSNITIIGGIFDHNSANRGGCILLRNNEDVRIESCLFHNSTTVYGSSVIGLNGNNITITNCNFTFNIGVVEFGINITPTVQAEITTNLLIEHCIFDNDSPYSIYVDLENENLQIIDSVFTSDHITLDDSEGGILIEGYVTGSIERCSFRNTTSSGGGAALLISMSSGLLSIVDCSFVGNSADHGGAVVIDTPGDVSFWNCLFDENKAMTFGGAVYVASFSTVSFHGSRFVDNLAVSSGGGMYLNSGVTLSLTNSTFLRNKSLKSGGGGLLSSKNNTLSIMSCVFQNNLVVYGGGGVEIGSLHPSVTIQDSRFLSNFARFGVGGLSIGSDNVGVSVSDCLISDNSGNIGGVSLSSSNSEVVFDDVILRNNYGVSQGGGLYVGNLNSYVYLNRCLFENNVADVGGGTFVSFSNSAITIENCNFTFNTASTAGGAIYFQSSNQLISVLDSRITHNDAKYGGGIYIYSNNLNVLLSNTSLDFNTAFVDGGGFYLAFQNRGFGIDGLRLNSNVAVDGGGCYLQSGNDHVNFLNSEFVDNIASGSGGGVYSQDSNQLMTLVNCIFISNLAHQYGGGINLHSSNFGFLLTQSTLIDNVADEAGGGLSSSLSNDNITVSSSVMIGSFSRYGGSLYIGTDHKSVTLSNLSISESVGESGGAIFVSSFNDHLLMENCEISYCQTHIGGVVTTSSTTTVIHSCYVHDVDAPDVPGILIDGIETFVSDSRFENNLSLEYGSGSLAVVDALLLIVSNSIFQSNVGYSGVGLAILNTASASLDNLQFHNNSGTLGGGVSAIGVLSLSLSNSNFTRNQAFYAGGAAYFSDVFDLTLSDISYSSNYCENFGGAVAAYYSTGTISSNTFQSNIAAFSGSAIYFYTTDILLSRNSFIRNEVQNGGGAVFWGPLTTMNEPRGLTNDSLNYFSGNIASYGPNWATDVATLKTDRYEYNVTAYAQPIPIVFVKLVDEYEQLVITDSSTNVDAIVSSYYCNDATAYITGKSSVQFVAGGANFSSLQAYCAPNYSMNLKLTAGISFYDVQTSIRLEFRACRRGEYYSGQECIPCESGTYSVSDDTSNLEEMDQISICHSCPQHVSSCEGSTLVLEKGYWRISMDSDHVQACPIDAACNGGESAGDDSCEVGYKGPLCAVCQSGYGFRSLSRVCVPCSESSGLSPSDILFLSVIVLLALLLVCYFSRPEIRHHLKSFDDFVFYLMVRAGILEIDETTDPKKVKAYIKLVAARLRARLKVYITLYQILSALPFVLDLEFPSPVNAIIYALNFINISISGSAVMTCSASSYDFIDSLVVETTYPIVFVLLLFSIQWIHFRIIRYRRRDESRAIVEDHISNISSSYFFVFLLFTYLILPSVATRIFQTFRSVCLSVSRLLLFLLLICSPHPAILLFCSPPPLCSCRDVDPDDSVSGSDVYMRADYSVSCDSEKYRCGYIWAIAMVFVYPVGCPLYYFYLLYDARNGIKTRFDNPLTETSTGEVSDESRLKRQKLLSLRFLYESYRPSYWWWELVETSQRLLLTGILVIIGQGSAIQILVGSLISLCYMFAHRQYEPDMDNLIFYIKTISFWQIFLVFWIALLIKADFHSISVEKLGVSLIFVIFLNLFLDLWKVCATAMARWCEGRKRRKDKSTTGTSSSSAVGGDGGAATFILLDEMRQISVVSETEMGRLSGVGGSGADGIERSNSKSIFSVMQSSPLHLHLSHPQNRVASLPSHSLRSVSSPSCQPSSDSAKGDQDI